MRDGPFIRQFDPDRFLALSGNRYMQRKRQAVVLRSNRGAGRVGDQRDIFTGAVLEHLADDMAGEIAVATAQLDRDVGCGCAAVTEREANRIESFCTGLGGGDFTELGIGIDGEGKLFEGEAARVRLRDNEWI